MSAVGQMWLWAILLPAMFVLTQNMCVWRTPRFLGGVALFLLYESYCTFLLFLAALPGFLYFGAASIIYRQTDGELVRRTSLAACCLFFMALWLLALKAAGSFRHRAFVQASRVGHQLVGVLARYWNDNGAYPDSLERLVPGYLAAIPYTRMIGYPEFSYLKDRNDTECSPGSYELRIDCTNGPINFDRFIYWPSETYPDRIQAKPVERIDKWAYVHE